MKLDTILGLSDPTQYKLHLASWNGQVRPLDAFIGDREERHDWSQWRSNHEDFNRRSILSLKEFHSEPGQWLFGEIYEVLASAGIPRSFSYTIRPCDEGADLVGRLLVDFSRPGRAKSLRLENHLERLHVSALLREPYTSRPFPGYENINHPFHELETIVWTKRPDWRGALQNVKGVDVIFDRSNVRAPMPLRHGSSCD